MCSLYVSVCTAMAAVADRCKMGALCVIPWTVEFTMSEERWYMSLLQPLPLVRLAWHSWSSLYSPWP